MKSLSGYAWISSLAVGIGLSTACQCTRGGESGNSVNSVVASNPHDNGTSDTRNSAVKAPAQASSTMWLHTDGNQILNADGKRFHGRGANIFDTRQCGSCAWAPPHVNEVIRRVDELVDNWHANFLRFNLVSYASNNAQGIDLKQWGDVLQDPLYLADVQKVIAHIGAKPGVYVLITLFSHPSQDAHGLPTDSSAPVYKKLSEIFKDSPHVLFGVTNEPHDATDEAVWNAMNGAAEMIRSVEPATGPHHLIAVQGTQGYARQLAYYLGKRITAGGGVNIIYETHVYNHTSEWASLFVNPAQYIPVIIGEFGPADPYMTLDESKALMAKAEEIEVPYLGWSFSPECAPGMLRTVDNNTDCGEHMSLSPNDWGTALRQHLATPW